MAGHLSRTLTAAQEVEADAQIEAAESFIDAHVGRSWLGTSVVEDHFYLPGSLLYLHGGGAASITSVVTRSAWNDTAAATLVSGTDYEASDLANGILYLPYWRSYQRIRVTYVPLAAVPPLVREACKKLAAFWMGPTLDDADGVKAFSIGDFSISYRDVAVERGVPSDVLVMLAPLRRLVVA